MRQLVDSFSPVRPANSRKALNAQYGAQWLRPSRDEPIPTVRAQHPHAPVKAQQIPYAQLIRPHLMPPSLQHKRIQNKAQKLRPYQVAPMQKTRTKPKGLFLRVINKLQLPAVIMGAVVLGLLMQSLAFGEIAICAYAILAFSIHISSRTTFQLAFIALVGIVVLSAIGKDSNLSTNFAIYTFLLILVGTISLIRESYRSLSV